jgi:SAM-dependent methyltransferase
MNPILEWAFFRFLKTFFPGGKGEKSGEGTYTGRGKAAALLGENLQSMVKDSTVVDFGCGEGRESIELVKLGATRVIGIDIQPEYLRRARLLAEEHGVSDRVEFAQSLAEPADVIVCLDAFEHFDDPEAIIALFATLIKDDGCVLISFGPPWYHPLGGHLFSVFPWAHLILPEGSLIRWRSEFKDDGATRFSEVAGGLNQMTVSRFERIIRNSQFSIEFLEAVPIRRLRRIHTGATREFTTSIVRATLRKRAKPS